MDDNVEMIFVWAFFAVSAAVIAHFKNRSLLLWVPLSTLFPVIGLAALALLPAGEPKVVDHGLATRKAKLAANQDDDYQSYGDNDSMVVRNSEVGGVSGKFFFVVLLLVLVGGYTALYQMNKAEKLAELKQQSFALCDGAAVCNEDVEAMVADCFDEALLRQGASRFTDGFQVVAEEMQGCMHSRFSIKPSDEAAEIEVLDEPSAKADSVEPVDVAETSETESEAPENHIAPVELSDIHQRVQRLLSESAAAAEQAEAEMQQETAAPDPQTEPEITRSRSDKAGEDAALVEERSSRHSAALSEAPKSKSKGEDDPELDFEEPEDSGKSLSY